LDVPELHDAGRTVTDTQRCSLMKLAPSPVDDPPVPVPRTLHGRAPPTCRIAAGTLTFCSMHPSGRVFRQLRSLAHGTTMRCAAEYPETLWLVPVK